jgi:hypothetical protein
MFEGPVWRTFLLALVAVAVTAGAARADRNGGGTTVIIKCVYVSDPGFATRGAGVEVAGPGQPPAVPGTTCAEAFNALLNAGFTIVHSGPIPHGPVDTADYVVWRKAFGAGADAAPSAPDARVVPSAWAGT